MVPSCAFALWAKRLRGLGLPAVVRVGDEGRVGVVLAVLAPDAEAERVPDVIHHAVDVRAEFATRHVEAHGLVAAGDVEPDGGGADAGLGCDDAADGHAVAEVAVGHEREAIRGLCADARLLKGVGFVFSEDGNVVDDLHCDSFLARRLVEAVSSQGWVVPSAQIACCTK